MAFSHQKSLEVTGGHWMSLEVTGGDLRSLEVTAGHWRSLEVKKRSNFKNVSKDSIFDQHRIWNFDP